MVRTIKNINNYTNNFSKEQKLYTYMGSNYT